MTEDKDSGRSTGVVEKISTDTSREDEQVHPVLEYIIRRGLSVPDDHESFVSSFTPLVEAVFDDTADKLLAIDAERNPLLEELFSIYASVHHNVGPYYQVQDVPAISLVMAKQIFSEDVLSNIHTILSETESFEYTERDFEYQRLMGFMPEKKSQKPNRIGKLLEARMNTVCSMDTGRTIPLIMGTEGVTIWDSGIAEDQTQQVTEWVRQDNADKSGANKYRVRQTTYTRHESAADSDQATWTCPDWIEEPSFWTSELRQGLQVLSDKLQTAVPKSRVFLIAEGGVFKGTATAGTDIDTSLYIYGDITDFPSIQSAADQLYAEMISHLPFEVKEGEHLRPQFFDRKSGKPFWRRDSGEFVEDNYADLSDESVKYIVRNNEQGILIIADGKQIPLRKPAELHKKGWYVRLDTDHFQILESSDQDITRTARDELKAFRDEVW